MGADPQYDQVMIRSSLLLVPPAPHAPEKGERLEIELTIDHTCMMKPPQKSQSYGAQKVSQLVSTSYQESGAPQLHEKRNAYAKDPSLCISSSGCLSEPFSMSFIINSKHK